MQYTWIYSRTRNQEFPEEFSILTPKQDRIKVEVNKLRGIVNIKLKTKNGDLLQSTIQNGHIIREKDLISQNTRNLENDFKKIHWEISTLPDDRVLKLIAGNYGIYTRQMGSLAVNKKSKNYTNIKSYLIDKIKNFIASTKKNSIKLYKSIFNLPTLWDVLELCFFGSLAYAVYLINFNFFISGFIASIGALLAGYSDILFKKRQPYILKIIILFFPGIFAVYFGFIMQ